MESILFSSSVLLYFISYAVFGQYPLLHARRFCKLIRKVDVLSIHLETVAKVKKTRVLQ